MILEEYGLENFGDIRTITLHFGIGREYLIINSVEKNQDEIMISPNYSEGVMVFDKSDSPLVSYDLIDCFEMKKGVRIVDLDVYSSGVTVTLEFKGEQRKLEFEFENYYLESDGDFIGATLNSKKAMDSVPMEFCSAVLCESLFFE